MLVEKSTSERGSGLVGSMFGALAFLAFLLLATNVMVGLYATTVASAAIDDAAHRLAVQPDAVTAQAGVDADLRERLRGFENVNITYESEPGRIGVHVRATRPSLLPPALVRSTRLTTVDRTSWARAETLR